MEKDNLLNDFNCVQVSIPSMSEYKGMSRYFRKNANAPFVSQVYYSRNEFWREPLLLSDGKEDIVQLKHIESTFFKLGKLSAEDESFCIRPKITIDVKKLLQNNRDKDIINQISSTHVGIKVFKTITLGEYPQTTLTNTENERLENLFAEKSSEIKMTGRHFTIFENRYGNICPRLVPEYEFEGKKFVRVCDSELQMPIETAHWKGVEPLEWVVISNPKTISKEGKLEAICTKMLFELNLTRSNGNLEYYLSCVSKYLDGEDKSDIFGSWGKFVEQVFAKNVQSLENMVVPKDQKILINNVLNGCYFIKSLTIHENCDISPDALNETNLRYVYKQGKDLIVKAEKTNQEEYFCDLRQLKSIFPQMELGELKTVNPTVMDLYNILRKENVGFDYSIVKQLIKNNKLEEFVKNSNFKFCKNSVKMYNEVFTDVLADSYKAYSIKLMFWLGCYSNQKVLDSSGKETEVGIAQLANQVFQTILKSDYKSLIVSPTQEENKIPSLEYNQEMLKFLLVKGPNNSFQNLEMINELNESIRGVLYIVIAHFDEIKSLRLRVNNRGLPVSRSWKDCILTYTTKQKYRNIPEGFENLAKEFATKGLNEYYFKKAVDLQKIARRDLVPHHILKKHLSEMSILEQIEEIKKQTNLSLEESKNLIDETYKKQFTFEMLDKYDPKGCIIGLYVECCCTITSDLYGADIAKDSILNYDVQHLVVKDYKNNIIGKGTLYVDRYTGYGVFNNFEYNLSVLQKCKDGSMVSNKVFEALMRGVRAFVEEYDKENPDNPIKKINVGMGYNNLAEQSRLYQKEKQKLSSPSEFRDAKKEQRILYERDKEFQIKIVEPENQGEQKE